MKVKKKYNIDNDFACKPKDEVKDARIAIPVTFKFKNHLDDVAKKDGFVMTSFCRDAIEKAFEEYLKNK